jgi:hypothetical protein
MGALKTGLRMENAGENAEKMLEIPGFGGFEGQTWRENDRNVLGKWTMKGKWVEGGLED